MALVQRLFLNQLKYDFYVLYVCRLIWCMCGAPQNKQKMMRKKPVALYFFAPKNHREKVIWHSNEKVIQMSLKFVFTEKYQLGNKTKIFLVIFTVHRRSIQLKLFNENSKKKNTMKLVNNNIIFRTYLQFK